MKKLIIIFSLFLIACPVKKEIPQDDEKSHYVDGQDDI